MCASKSVRDNVLFRILETKGQTTSLICKKLKKNIKNVDLLSEDELCELWLHVKVILIEAHKFCIQLPNDTEEHKKEHVLMIQLIHAITAMALHTILNRTFIPNILVEIVIIFHNAVLPDLEDKKVKDRISYFLENWWKLNLIWKEKVIVNALKYLLQECESSLQHVRRLHNVQSASSLLKSAEDKQALLKIVRNKTVLSLKEGQAVILHLFTLGKEHIMGIHQNIKVVLENARVDMIIGYANIYRNAWLNTKDKVKKLTIENCLHNLIFHCLRANRDSTGRQSLGKNLLTFVSALHSNKNNAVKEMLYNQYKTLLWKHLKASGSDVRCNAAEVLFAMHPLLFSSEINGSNIGHRKYYHAMTELLNDKNLEVCIIAINGIFNLLHNYWSKVPRNFIQIWLNVLIIRVESCPNSELKVEVFLALKQLADNQDSHKVLQNILPRLAESIHDSNVDVVDAFVRLLLNMESHTKISVFDIVPKKHILDRLEIIEDGTVLRQLIKLVWLHISSNIDAIGAMQEEMIQLGMNNINALKKFCLHSKHVINWNVSLKLIANCLSTIEKELRNTSLKAVYANGSTINDNENTDNCASMIKYPEREFHGYENICILIDIVATLLASKTKKLGTENCNAEEKSVFTSLANILPTLCNFFKNTSMHESILFLFSLMSPSCFSNEIAITEMLVKELNNAKNSDDVLLTIVYVVVNWQKPELIFNVLSNLFARPHDQIVPDNEVADDPTNERNLELGQRILKHLLHVTNQSGLTNYYYEGIIEFWGKLQIVRNLVKEKLDKNITRDSLLSDEIVLNLFSEYILLVPSLHKEGIFDASECLSEILSWIKRTVMPCVPKTDNAEENQFSINILKNTLSILHNFLKEYKISPKSCCDVVLLYCGCISLPNGIIFFNDTFDAIISVLEYSKTACPHQETNLMRIVVPNFLCATMITLTRYPEETIITHTNNLKNLPTLIQKYFSAIESIPQNRVMHLSYITIMFNTAVSSISSMLSNMLQGESIVINDILHSEHPYLARKLLKNILHGKKNLELCTQVLANTITKFEKVDIDQTVTQCGKHLNISLQIDMLSAMLIIHKMFKFSDNVSVKRLKNITLVVRLHNQKQVHCTPLDRSIMNAMNFVIGAILQE